MSDISTIRSLIGDQILYDRVTKLGDGVAVEFQVPNYPVYPDSETVTIDGVAQLSSGSPIDYTIDDSIGLITFTAAPVDDASVIITHKHTLLTDIQIQEFLDLEDDSVRLAAADALDAIAANQVLVQKKIKVLDLQTDGPAVAEALHKLAADYRKMVADAALLESEESEFDYAEQINEPYGWYERVMKDLMRQG